MSKCNVVVIENDPAISDFLAASLSQAGYIVDLVSDGCSGLRLLSEHAYAAVIVDRMMSVVDVFSFITEMRAKKNYTPVIILSTIDTVSDRVRCLEIGADDYLVKPFHISELLARVQTILRRSTPNSVLSGIAVADLTLDLVSRKVARSGCSIELKPPELVLLEYLMRNAGQVVSRNAIVKQVWGYDNHPATNLVDVQICRLRTKVDKDFDTKLLHTIRGQGYVLASSTALSAAQLAELRYKQCSPSPAPPL